MKVGETGRFVIILLWFIWCTALLVISLKGSAWLRKHSEQQDRVTSFYQKYEKLVSYWMIFVAIGIVCMMTLVILALSSRQ